jgi:hypothetical protein
VVLFVLGVVQGVFGSFQFSRLAPVFAIVLCVILGASCLLAAWGTRSVSGAFAVAAGWALASFALSTRPVANGSVIITASAAGEWYLYGGTLCAAVAVIISFVNWSRARSPRAPSSGSPRAPSSRSPQSPSSRSPQSPPSR